MPKVPATPTKKTCRTCQQLLLSISKREAHEKSCKGKGPVKRTGISPSKKRCPVCKKEFSKPSLVNRHLEKNSFCKNSLNDVSFERVANAPHLVKKPDCSKNIFPSCFTKRSSGSGAVMEVPSSLLSLSSRDLGVLRGDLTAQNSFLECTQSAVTQVVADPEANSSVSFQRVSTPAIEAVAVSPKKKGPKS